MPLNARKPALHSLFAESSKAQSLLLITQLMAALEVETVEACLSLEEPVSVTRDAFHFDTATSNCMVRVTPNLREPIGRSKLFGMSLLNWALCLTYVDWSDTLAAKCVDIVKVVINAADPHDLEACMTDQRDGFSIKHAVTQICLKGVASAIPGVLETLLRTGLFKSEINNGSSSALQLAIMRAPADAVQLLLDTGIDVNREVPLCRGPLHTLAAIEAPDTAKKVEILVRAGAALEARDENELTPLLKTIASKIGSLTAFDALLAAGADPRVLGGKLTGLSSGKYIHIVHCVAARGDVPAMSKLLDPAIIPAGIIDADAMDGDGVRAIELAAQNDDHRMLKLLIDAGGAKFKPPMRGGSPLLAAVRCGSFRTAKALIKAGAVAGSGECSKKKLLRQLRTLSNQHLALQHATEVVRYNSASRLTRTPEEVREGMLKIVTYLEECVD